MPLINRLLALLVTVALAAAPAAACCPMPGGLDTGGLGVAVLEQAPAASAARPRGDGAGPHAAHCPPAAVAAIGHTGHPPTAAGDEPLEVDGAAATPAAADCPDDGCPHCTSATLSASVAVVAVGPAAALMAPDAPDDDDGDDGFSAALLPDARPRPPRVSWWRLRPPATSPRVHLTPLLLGKFLRL